MFVNWEQHHPKRKKEKMNELKRTPAARKTPRTMAWSHSGNGREGTETATVINQAWLRITETGGIGKGACSLRQKMDHPEHLPTSWPCREGAVHHQLQQQNLHLDLAQCPETREATASGGDGVEGSFIHDLGSLWHSFSSLSPNLAFLHTTSPTGFHLSY